MVFSLFAVSSANAAAIDAPSGFSVEPAILHVSVAPGMQFKSSFAIRNTGALPIKLKISVADFEPVDSTGGVHALPGIGVEDDPIRASGWFSVPKEEVVIPARQKLSIPFSISAPDDASPGGRSVVFAIESEEGNVRSRVNSLCFLDVSGDAKESLLFTNYSFHPFLTSRANGVFHFELFNDGKTHARPEGEIVVRNMFGVERGRFPLSSGRALGTIIPSAKRSAEYAWTGSLNLFDFGLWNARAELRYGVTGDHTIADRAFFLVLPWKTLLMTLLVVGGAIYFFVFAVRRLRRDMEILRAEEHHTLEAKMSIKLLIIPIVAGILLLIMVTSVLFSVLQQTGEGTLERVQKV